LPAEDKKHQFLLDGDFGDILAAPLQDTPLVERLLKELGQ
jgi:hypothetical protein